jgi:hypothetical protein
MIQFPLLENIRNRMTLVTVEGELTASAAYTEFKCLVRAFISDIEVDEAWYLERYPDVAEAIEAGFVESAKQHFAHHGYFEGRMPFEIRVDEVWYLAQYPEVADAIRSGLVKSAQQHFEKNGYREGRLPWGKNFKD